MYTLALDEYGDFEGVLGGKSAIFIAGIIYDDCGDRSDLIEELQRIRAYYSKICVECNTYYPNGLHVGKNGRNVARVKSTITKSLGEFLRQGTYKGEKLQLNGNLLKDRTGAYQIFIVLKSDEGKRKRLEEHADFLLSDTHTSNLYFHMVNEVIERAVFQHPFVSPKTVYSLHLATRKTATFKRNSDIYLAYEGQGYKKIDKIKDKDVMTENNEKGAFFEVTNKDIYRTIIEQYVSDRNDLDIKIENFMVCPINYSKKPTNLESDKQYSNVSERYKAVIKEYKYEMLYLADSVNSILSFQLEKIGSGSNQWLGEIWKRAENLISSKSILMFGYDDIDTKFAEALHCFKMGEFYKALQICYFAKREKGVFAAFYNEHWFSYIEKRIIEEVDIKAIQGAVEDLYNSMMRDSNTYHQGCGIYILQIVEKAVEKAVKSIEINNYIKSNLSMELYIVGLKAYCHIGNSKMAQEYFEKLTPFTHLLKLEQYVSLRNSLSTCYSDGFEWKKAVEIAMDNVKLEKNIAEQKRKIFGGYTGDYVDEAISLSQLGQMLSFSGMRKAEQYFKDSLDKMGEQSDNYFITESYLLHHYVDMGECDSDKKLYEKKYKVVSSDFFGGKDELDEMFEYIFIEGLKCKPLINLKYALYLFLKGIYVFYLNEITDELWKKIRDIDKYVNTKYHKMLTEEMVWGLDNNHPVELIYKYIALIAIKKLDTETLYKAKNRILSVECECTVDSSQNGDIIRAIICKAKIDMANAENKMEERDNLILELAKFMKEKYEAFKNINLEDLPDKIYSQLKVYIRYMYN